MNWLNKLERKFGNWAIPNLIVWLIGAYTIGFVLYQVNPSIIGLLMLSPYHILHGQIWRLITWVFMPTDTNLVYLLIMALSIISLERHWSAHGEPSGLTSIFSEVCCLPSSERFCCTVSCIF